MVKKIPPIHLKNIFFFPGFDIAIQQFNNSKWRPLRRWRRRRAWRGAKRSQEQIEYYFPIFPFFLYVLLSAFLFVGYKQIQKHTRRIISSQIANRRR